jgi:TusA-related sulfurtransferase
VKDKTDYTLDVRGAISPFSLLKVSLVFQNMRPEEVVEILGCDPEMRRDLLRVLPADACEVVRATPEDADPDGARVWLKKIALTTAH